MDTVADFVAGTDKLQFSEASFTGLGTGTTLLAGQFWAAAGAVRGHDADDRIIYNTTTGALYYDADGSGAGAAIQVALLGVSAHPVLAFTDFVLTV